jgi:hypothetical protein
MSNNKFIIYKATGGLFHNLNCLFSIIDFAILNHYTLIIDMKQHSAFNHSFSTFFDLNVQGLEWYDNYDNIPNTLKYGMKNIKELENSSVTYYNDKDYKGYYLHDKDKSDIDFKTDKNVSGIDLKKHLNDDIIVYAGSSMCNKIYYKNLTVNNEIYNKLINEKHIKNNYISVHFRNTDIKNNINEFIKKIKKCIESTNIKTLYLASDYYEMYDIIKKNINIEIIRYTIPPKDINNLHYCCEGSIEAKYDRIYESIRDIYFILKSQAFIPSYNSGFSKEIIKMINSKKYIIPNIECNTKIY